jgi:hypothetical protein
MPQTSVVRKIYKWKPFTGRPAGRPAGRPKSRWEDDFRNDMRRMQLVKWTEHVQDLPKWKVIVEKAKTLPKLKRRKRSSITYSVWQNVINQMFRNENC